MDFNKVLFTGPTLNSFMCFVIIIFYSFIKSHPDSLKSCIRITFCFLSVALCKMVVTTFLGELYFIAEIITLILIASMYYPTKIHHGDDGNRKPVRLLSLSLEQGCISI